jgi:hypothetical protein
VCTQRTENRRRGPKSCTQPFAPRRLDTATGLPILGL